MRYLLLNLGFLSSSSDLASAAKLLRACDCQMMLRSADARKSRQAVNPACLPRTCATRLLHGLLAEVVSLQSRDKGWYSTSIQANINKANRPGSDGTRRRRSLQALQTCDEMNESMDAQGCCTLDGGDRVRYPLYVYIVCKRSATTASLCNQRCMYMLLPS